MKAELTTKQLAERWGVSHDSIVRWIRKGKIKARRGGLFVGLTSPFLIPISEVERVERDRLKRENTKAS